jgi:hypothetical protein
MGRVLVGDGTQIKATRGFEWSWERLATADYRLLVREAGVALGRDLALALFRTVIVRCEGAGVGETSAYFFVDGQIRRHG